MVVNATMTSKAIATGDDRDHEWRAKPPQLSLPLPPLAPPP